MRDVHVVPFWNAEMVSLSVALGSLVQRLEKHVYTRGDSPLAVACSCTALIT
jgi:hypothetical protein